MGDAGRPKVGYFSHIYIYILCSSNNIPREMNKIKNSGGKKDLKKLSSPCAFRRGKRRKRKGYGGIGIKHPRATTQTQLTNPLLDH